MRPTPAIRSLALATLLVALGVACPARPVGAEEPAADTATSIEEIRTALALWLALPATPAREITPHVLHPDDATRAIELRGGFPNPFRRETAIRFAVPAPTHVQVRLFDVSGRVLRTLVDAQLPAGDHSAMVQAEGLNPGVYFVRLRAGAVSVTRRLTLIR